jgi:hypothetical protein
MIYTVTRLKTGDIEVDYRGVKCLFIAKHIAQDIAEFLASEVDSAHDAPAEYEVEYEYAAVYPVNYALPEGDWEKVETGVDRKRADVMVSFVNSRADRDGFGKPSYVVKRVVVRTEWEKVPTAPIIQS